MKKLFIFAIFYLFVSLFFVRSVSAQTPTESRLDLTVSPPVIELTAKPGDTLIEKFRVRNNNSVPVNLQISVRRLISDPTDGNPIPEEEAKGEELKWVTFDRPEFTASPLEWQDVTFTIDIPTTAAYGYYYVFKIAPKDDKAVVATGTKVKGEILVVTLLNVKKDGAVSKAELVKFSAKDMVSQYLPAEFVVKLANRGNVHVKPRGNIFITRGGGKEIGILEVNPNLGSILPSGTREFESSWADGFLVNEPVIEGDQVKVDENGKPVMKLQINWNKLTDFRIGPYEAKLLMVYDDGNKDVVVEGATTFWVIPYTIIGATIITLLVLFFVIKFFLRMYIKKAIAGSKR
jgi:hypothetical protein